MAMPKTFKDGDESFYYIHRHIQHFNKSEAVARFQNQKDQDYTVMRQRYKSNYLQNVQGLTPIAEKKLKLAESKDEVLTAVDQAFLDSLNNSISKAIKKYDLEGHKAQAFASLDLYIKTKDLKYLDAVFKHITRASTILRTHPKEIIAAVGQGNWLKSGRSLTKIKEDIHKQILALEGRRFFVSKPETMAILRELEGLTEGLSAQELNTKSLYTRLTHIFSTNLGEYLVSKGVIYGFNEAHSILRKSLVGSKHLKMTNSLKELLTLYPRTNLTYKTDNTFKNLTLTVKDGEAFKINLGLSAKWYEGMGSGLGDSVHITTETNFIGKINQLLASGKGRYYIYNALALVNQDGTAYAALKAAIVARAADFIISGYGVQGDFSQYLVINGDFYSIWQLVLALQYFNAGQGHSALSPGTTDPITVSAMGLKDIAQKTQDAGKYDANLYEAFQRAKEQNHMMEDLSMGAYFYPNRLKNALQQMKTKNLT